MSRSDPVLAVTAPTGRVGSHVVRLLLQAGVRPRLLLRDTGRLDPETRALVDTRVGDLDDASYVHEATAGADALFWLDPTDFGADDPGEVTIRRGRHAAEAVRAHGIGHVVFQSSVGAEKRHGVGLIDGLGAVEEMFDATGAHVLHLRCGYFFTNLLLDPSWRETGQLVTTMTPDVSLPWVAPRDIGDVVAARLLARSWTGRRVEAVHGPRDLTWLEAAAALSAAAGREVRLDVRSDDDIRAQLSAMGMSATAVEGVVGMTAGLRDGFTPEQPRTLLSTTPTTLESWLVDALADDA